MTTVNYSWTLPTIGETYDIWGGWLNTILTDIDAKMVSKTDAQTLTNKTLAAPVITGGASISGNVSVAGDITSQTGTNTILTVKTTSASGVTGAAGLYLGDATTAYASSITYRSATGLLELGIQGAAKATISSTGLAVAGDIAGPNITTTVNVIAETTSNSNGQIALNYWGYNKGTTQFRDVEIFNGKNGSIAKFEGSSGNFLPGTNGGPKLGSTSLRWGELWVTTGAFNTSNAILKTPVRTMQAQELAAGYQMAQELGTFQWLESVKEKGDKARRHVGLTVQRAAEIMESHRLDPWSYGFMGYDKWEAVTEVVDATEDDEGAYLEEVTRQKTEKQTSQHQAIEIVNGKPVLKVETVESDVPIAEQIQVVDADGKPVFIDVQEVPAVLDEEGNEATPAIPAHQVPLMHAVPVMETVQVWKRVKEVRTAGESYAFRSDQLAFFIAAGVAAKARA